MSFSVSKTPRLLLALALLLTGGVLLALSLRPWNVAHVMAPELELVLVNGAPLALNSLEQQPVLINFWSLSCTRCLEELPQTLRHYRQWQPLGLALIAVAAPYDPPAEVVSFQRRRQLPYPVALDLDGRVAQAFGGIRGTPSWLLIAPGGAVVWRHSGQLDWEALAVRIAPYLTPS